MERRQFSPVKTELISIPLKDTEARASSREEIIIFVFLHPSTGLLTFPFFPFSFCHMCVQCAIRYCICVCVICRI